MNYCHAPLDLAHLRLQSMQVGLKEEERTHLFLKDYQEALRSSIQNYCKFRKKMKKLGIALSNLKLILNLKRLQCNNRTIQTKRCFMKDCTKKDKLNKNIRKVYKCWRNKQKLINAHFSLTLNPIEQTP